MFWLHRRGVLAPTWRNVLCLIPYGGGNCQWSEGTLSADFCSVFDFILDSSVRGTKHSGYSGKANEHVLNFEFINAFLNSVRVLCV